DVMVPSWRDQARGNSGSRDDRLTFSCQCHLGEQLQRAGKSVAFDYPANEVSDVERLVIHFHLVLA
ncbi:hypothetical protein, partial [Aeromonas caviae]|uniref:hypothetical protein n=1 Tax=Aeromonas caviae TaxID=648 RepID=UPI003014F480